MSYLSEKNDLLGEVKNKIKEIHSGSIAVSEGYGDFKNLFRRYKEISHPRGESPVEDFLTGILAQHNANNFCRVSALAGIEMGAIEVICSYGDNELLGRINYSDIAASNNNVITMRLSGITLNIKQVSASPDIKFFAAGSGSVYFDINYFIKTAELISDICADLISDTGAQQIESLHVLFDKISRSFGGKIDIFTIKNSSAIFLPRDTNNFININRHIDSLFRNHYPDAIISHNRISLGKFAVFKNKESVSFSNKTLTIAYNGVNLVCGIDTYEINHGTTGELIKELFT